MHRLSNIYYKVSADTHLTDTQRDWPRRDYDKRLDKDEPKPIASPNVATISVTAGLVPRELKRTPRVRPLRSKEEITEYSRVSRFLRSRFCEQ